MYVSNLLVVLLLALSSFQLQNKDLVHSFLAILCMIVHVLNVADVNVLKQRKILQLAETMNGIIRYMASICVNVLSRLPDPGDLQIARRPHDYIVSPHLMRRTLLVTPPLFEPIMTPYEILKASCSLSFNSLPGTKFNYNKANEYFQMSHDGNGEEVIFPFHCNTKRKPNVALTLLHPGNLFCRLGKSYEAIHYDLESIKLRINAMSEAIIQYIASICVNVLSRLPDPGNLQIATPLQPLLVTPRLTFEPIVIPYGNYLESINFRKAMFEKLEALVSLILDHMFKVICNYNKIKAKEYHHKALNICEISDDETGEEVPLCVYSGLGNISQGDYGNAIGYYQKASKVTVKREHKTNEALTLLCRGNRFCRLGKSNEAINYYLESINIAQNIVDRADRGMTEAIILGRLGSAYHYVRNTKKARECFEKQLDLSNVNGFKKGEDVACMGLGKILYSEGKYDDAMYFLGKSLEIAVTINDKGTEGQTLLELGDCYFVLKNYDEAFSCYEKSLTTARAIKHKSTETLANKRLGMFFLELANSDVALSEKTGNGDNYKKSELYLREAIKLSDLLFNNLQADQDDFKISLFKKNMETYCILTEVLIHTQQTHDALLVSEHGRGRSLTDILNSKYHISCQDAESLSPPLSTYDEVQAFVQSSKLCILFYSMTYRCITWVLVHNQTVYCHLHETGVQTFRKMIECSTLKDKNSLLSHSCDIKKLVDEAYLIMGVKDAGINQEDRSLDAAYKARGLSDAEQAARSKSTDDKAPTNQIEQFQEFPKTAKATNVQRKRNPFVKLFDILIAPVQSSLTQEEIVIVPQGPLYLVPFAALRDSKTGLYLCQTKRIRLAPSLSALKTWQECPAGYHSELEELGALVIGNPTVGKVMLKGEERTLEPLPKAQHEAEYIGERLGVTALTGSHATKEEVKSRLAKGVAVIHIAAHADPQNGEIALAPSESAILKGIPEEEDYLLTMKEVQQIGIRAKLVVLSCCHSGRGDIEPEGVVGMSRAFLAAGARAVIASYWAIDDFVTLSFMVSLYAYLKRGYSASTSLHKAMNEIREEDGGKYSHPKYWAPFFLIGDDVTIF